MLNPNPEGLLLLQEVEKICDDSLAVKELDIIDMEMLRPYIHTPKTAIREPVDTVSRLKQLDEKGFLLFDSSQRPSHEAYKQLKEYKKVQAKKYA